MVFIQEITLRTAKVHNWVSLISASGLEIASVYAYDFLIVGVTPRAPKQDGIVPVLQKRKPHLRPP